MKEYERLTKKGGWHEDIDLKNEYGYKWIYQRLAELEDKIENGTLIELPCKAYNNKYQLYQIITKSKQGNIYSSKFYGKDWIKYEMKKRGIEE